MKSIYQVLKDIKNLLPYLALISLYFFFVNIEAKKEKNFKKTIDKEYRLLNKKSKSDQNQIRIAIPVIPYKK